jgi:hypothetical protein
MKSRKRIAKSVRRILKERKGIASSNKSTEWGFVANLSICGCVPDGMRGSLINVEASANLCESARVAVPATGEARQKLF